ncbi:MAG: serine/threonine-protein kinase, partial [Planctomycetota bacterium]
MAVDTAEDFFAVLEKSGLLSAEQSIDSRLAAGRDPARRNDPKAIAKALARKGLVTRWQAGQLLAGRSSFFLGKYKLIEPIGRGGMGSVFLAEHTTMNRRVALKILSRQVGKDPASLERFLDEARAVAALDHPNIVQAYSVDHDADRYYLVMEYIDGRDLKRLVEEEGLPDYHSAADYIRQAADGLAHGHAQNMIHCDVKPSNLLVNHQGQVKIVDMGLTRLNGREQEEGNGEGERVLGSVDYLAPEQALERSDFDHRADIYSLGCTLYFLLTGHPPFPEGTLSERLVKHQMQQPRSIHRERADAPPGLVRICERMMAKRAEDRFQSAEEVSSVLAEWQLREPKHKRIVPLKTAQPLDEPAEGRLPKIDVDAEPGPTAATGGSEDDPSKKVGLFRTRRQKIVALVVAGLAVAAVAAATAALLIGPASAPPDPDPTGAGASEAGAEKNGSAHTRPTPFADLPAERNVPPPEKPPPDKPPPDRPPEQKTPDDKPAADPPQTDTPQTDRPQPDKPEPKEPKDGPQDPEEKPQEPQDKDPLGGLATSVDLPVLPAKPAPDGQPSVPVSLGELQLAPTAALDIELKGGNDA